MTNPDHYKTLGVSNKATDDELKKAYHQMAKQFHPDKNKAADAEEKFKEIGAAYEVLKDQQKRRVYDMQRDGDAERARAKKQQPSGTHGTGGATHWSFGSNTKPSNGTSYSEYTRTNPGFNFRSNFTSFDDDEFFKRAKREFENMGKANRGSTGKNAGGKSSQKSKKKKDSKPTASQRRPFDYTQPDWDSNWNEDPFGGKTGKKEHSSPFFSFGGAHFMDDPFADFDDMFEDFLRDPFFTAPKKFNGDDFFVPRPQTNPNAKFSSPKEDSGLDDSMNENDFFEKPSRQSRPRKKQSNPEEDMWNWSKPMFNKRNKDVDTDYDFLSDSDDDDHETLLMTCSYCKRKFSPAALSKHESLCRRWNPPTSRTSKSSEKEDNENANPGGYTFKSRNRDWRKQHEDLMNSAKNPKRGSKIHREPRSESTPPPPKTPYLIECRWCHRRFNDEAAKRHIPFCRDRMQGPSPGSKTPHNPMTGDSMPSKTQQAKEYARNVPKPNTPRPKAAPTNASQNHPKTAQASTGTRHKPPTGSTSEPSTPRMPNIFRNNPGSRNRGPDLSNLGTPRTARAGGDGTRNYGSRSFMDQPFTFTSSSGLHSQPSATNLGGARGRSPAGNHGNSGTTGGISGKNVHFNVPRTGPSESKSRPRSASPDMPKRRARQSQSFDANSFVPPERATQGCVNCQRSFGPNVASFTCSCGTKTAQL